MQGLYGASKRRARPAAKALGLLALLGLGLWLAPPGTAQPGEARIQVADVTIQGNYINHADYIMSRIKIRAGGEYTRTTLMVALKDDTRSLTETRLFKDVRPEVLDMPDGRVTIIFHVIELPNVIQEIIYKNAGHISKKDLDEMTQLRRGGPMNPAQNREACNHIQDHLKRKGRYFASVRLEEGDKPTDRRVVFNVTEGPVVRVKRIRFIGNDELASDARLATQIDSGKAFLGLLGGKFDPTIADNDVVKLTEYYRANGYMDARITRELVFSEDYGYVDLIFHVHEGQRYRVQDVQVVGPHQLKEEQVGSILRLHKGDYYKEAAVANDLHNIQDLYGWRGYEVAAKKEVYSAADPGLVKVVYEVEEKAPARVGQIIIIGNQVTKDRVIRRVIGLYPGQLLRYPELRIAEADLARLGIFKVDPENNIRPTLTVIDNPDSDFKDILVRVQEQPTGSLMFGAGLSSNAGFVGSIVLNEKNFDIFRPPTSLADIFEGRAFRGAGQEFRIEAVPGFQLQRYSATFREPYLFDLPYSLTTSGYYYNRIFNEYIEGREGGRFTLGRQLNRYWGVNGGLRIENINVSHLGEYLTTGFGLFNNGIPNANPNNPPSDYTSVLGNNFLWAPRIGATFNSTDSYLRPTAGGIMDMSFEEGLGEFTFPIINLEASRYFTIYQRPDGSGKHVFAVRSHFGWAGTQTPVYERFFAGGYQSIRGFQFRGVGPRQSGFNVGGDFLFLNGMEYQIPVLANDMLYLVAFLDSGTVESRVEILNYRVTAGFGARISIPMMGPVPIAIDFGFPIVKAPFDVPQIFNIWMGVFR